MAYVVSRFTEPSRHREDLSFSHILGGEGADEVRSGAGT